MIEHRRLDVGGLTLHVALDGPADGPLVLLLHGFPEFWYAWRHQLPALAAAGFRVAAPDQRGYGESDKPSGLSAYTREALVGDVVGLIGALGRERATLVGHDWGGAVAWWTALQHPDRVDRLAVLNIPHPAVFARAALTSRQALRSWYILFFQLPWLPERLLARQDHRRLLGLLVAMSAPGAFTEEDLARYREALARPAALTSMLAWYRAALRRWPGRLPRRRVSAPTLIIWGRRDRALGAELAAPSLALCDAGRLLELEEAGHFVALDAAERVNQALLAFLSEGNP